MWLRIENLNQWKLIRLLTFHVGDRKKSYGRWYSKINSGSLQLVLQLEYYQLEFVLQLKKKLPIHVWIDKFMYIYDL
jgi:hypothetical protein